METNIKQCVTSNQIETFTYSNGEIQRVQIVRFDDFNALKFITPAYDANSFTRLCGLYRDYIIPRYSMVFGKVVIFNIPDDEIPFAHSRREGEVFDSLSVVTMEFKKHIRCKRGKISFDDTVVEDYYNILKEKGLLFVAEGKRNTVSFLPVGKHMGYLSRCEVEAAVKVNTNFFVMDQFDCGSSFDHVGIPIGLMIENGRIINPPQYEREAFMVYRDGSVAIKKVSLKEVSVRIAGNVYRHGDNAVFYERPEYSKTPKGGTDLVILNNSVVAVNTKGKSQIPDGGFVIKVKEEVNITEKVKVEYEGFSDVSFGIQVGNSAIIDGKPTDRFISPFYNFMKFYGTSYPPSMYPLNYEKDRAPRIVLGADAAGKGMILWYEGAGKFGYKPGIGSCGASLSEAAEIAGKVGMVNGVHLDGGGSAQILINNSRALECSERDPEDFTQLERAVPVGLMIK